MKKKQAILKAATKLFALQGFDATTTQQIALESKVTEPLIYYHWQGKDELFTHIIENSFDVYFSRLSKLPKTAPTAFAKITNLFDSHFTIVVDQPEAIRIIVSNCPARLHDPKSLCLKNYRKARQFLFAYFSECLQRGISSGEFRKVSIQNTANMLVALINGLLRQKIFQLADTDGVKEATIDFCRHSLLAYR